MVGFVDPIRASPPVSGFYANEVPYYYIRQILKKSCMSRALVKFSSKILFISGEK